MRDRVTQRVHFLSDAPPALKPKRAKNGGIMRCFEWLRGGCPYQERYACSEGDRREGLRVGRCIVELRHREELGAPLRDLVHHLDGDERTDALEGLERLLDALVYRDRAAAYGGVVMDQDPAWMESDRYWSTVIRYREAGSQRVWRRYLELRPLLEKAKEQKARAEWQAKVEAAYGIVEQRKGNHQVIGMVTT